MNQLIYTHMSVDLDAVSSTWATKTFVRGFAEAEVRFVPANWNGAELREGDLAVDIDAGGHGRKGHKDPDGNVFSCFASIVREFATPDDQAALRDLMTFIDAQDAFGLAVKHLAPEATREAQAVLGNTGINAVLRALQAVHPRNDAVVCERMSEIFSGLLQAGRARQRAVSEADRATILPEGKVAIVVNSREFATNGILFEERSVKVVVYVDGHNLGCVREGSLALRMDHPEIRAVVAATGELEEWFAHSAGFLFCRGSRKAPATSPSRVDPRVLAETFARLL